MRQKFLLNYTNQVFVWKKSFVENLNVIVCDNHCGHNFVKEGKNGSVVTVSFPYVLQQQLESVKKKSRLTFNIVKPENFKNPGQEPLDETDSVDFTCFYLFFLPINF